MVRIPSARRRRVLPAFSGRDSVRTDPAVESPLPIASWRARRSIADSPFGSSEGQLRFGGVSSIFMFVGEMEKRPPAPSRKTYQSG